MSGGGLLQLFAYGNQDINMYSYDNMRFHRGYSTVIYKRKYKKFTGKNNFYEHIKKHDNKISKKNNQNNQNNVRERGSLIDEYSGKDNDSRYIDNIYYTSNIPEYTKLFSSDKVCINKGIYVNNNRKYSNFKLLFQYRKSDNYQYLTSSLNDILKTKI